MHRLAMYCKWHHKCVAGAPWREHAVVKLFSATLVILWPEHICGTVIAASIKHNCHINVPRPADVYISLAVAMYAIYVQI